MKTRTEIEQRAYAVATMHFYADFDGGQLWEPFEHYPTKWVEQEIESMKDMLVDQMIWAQSAKLDA